jgi:hypothetical protein
MSSAKLSQIANIMSQSDLSDDEKILQIEVIILTEKVKSDSVKIIRKKKKDKKEIDYEKGNENIDISNVNELGDDDKRLIAKCLKLESEDANIIEDEELKNYFEEFKKNYKSGVYTNIEIEEFDKIKLFKDWKETKSKSKDVKISFEDGVLLCRKYEKEYKIPIKEDSQYRGVNIGLWLRRHKTDGEEDEKKLKKLKKIKTFSKISVKTVNNKSFDDNIADCIKEEKDGEFKTRDENGKNKKSYTFISNQKKRYKKIYDDELYKTSRHLTALTEEEITKLSKIAAFKEWKDEYDKTLKHEAK